MQKMVIKMNMEKIKILKSLKIDLSNKNKEDINKLINEDNELKKLLDNCFPDKNIDASKFEDLNLNDNILKIVLIYFDNNGFNFIFDDEKLEDEIDDDYFEVDSKKAFVREIQKYKMLDYEETCNLFKEYNRTKDPKIKEIIFKSNLRLVLYFANKKRDRGIELLDLIQEANIALLKAIDKYDYTRGTRFSTYAVYYIKTAINNTILDKARIIRLPRYVSQGYDNVKNEIEKYKNEYEKMPSLEYLSEKTGFSVQILKDLLLYNEPVSINQTVGDDDTTLDEFIADNIDVEDVALDKVFKEELSDSVNDVLNMLTKREREVIILRYGIKDGKKRTLEEVGKIFGITRERVRQLEARALNKLRHPKNTVKILHYLNK